MKGILFNGGHKTAIEFKEFFYESKFTDSSHKGGSSNIDSYRFPFQVPQQYLITEKVMTEV